MILTYFVSIFWILEIDSFVYWDELTNVCCSGTSGAAHNNLTDAQNYCEKSGDDCKFVYDVGCDKKDYFTCHTGTLAKNDKPGVNVCGYAKGNFHFW